VNTPACPYPVRPRLVLKNFVLDKNFSFQTPHKKQKFKNDLDRKFFFVKTTPKYKESSDEIQQKFFVQDMSRTSLGRTG